MATQVRLTLSGLILFAQLASIASAACYYPNGDIAPNDTPCQDDTDNAVCCGQGYACLSNGICQATGKELQKPDATVFVRGSCTDRFFRSSKCPLFCIDPDIDSVNGGAGLEKCANTEKDMYYCINDNQDDVSCEDGEGVLYFAGTPTILTTIGVAPTSTVKSSTDSESSSSATGSNEDGGGDDSSDNTGAIAGGVIGGVVALFLGVTVTWWFLRKRKQKLAAACALQSIRDQESPGNQMSQGGNLHEGPLELQSWKHEHYSPVYEVSSGPDARELPTGYNEHNARW